MNESTQPGSTRPDDEREALNEAEEKASAEQPGSYKPRETKEKVVEIPPAGGTDERPIRGLDPR